MNLQSKLVVFFDIGETLGSPKSSPGPNRRISGLEVYPYVPEILKQLAENNVRLGIISNTGTETAERVNEVLKHAGILEYFDPQLLVYSSVVGCEKNSPRIFKLAADKAGHFDDPQHCIYVGEDKEELNWASVAGLATVPHPKLVWDVVNGSRLRYVRIKPPDRHVDKAWRDAIEKLAVVPAYVTGEHAAQIYAVASTAAAAALDDLGFEVIRLGSEGDPFRTDLYLLRDNRRDRSGFLAADGQSVGFSDRRRISPHVLCSSHDGLFVAIPVGESIEDYRFAEPYQGFRKKLLIDPGLLRPFGTEPFLRAAAWLAAPAAAASLSDEELDIIKAITSDQIRTHVERYSGVTPIDGSGLLRIESRHVNHPGNALTVETLLRDMKKLLGDDRVTTHRFTYRGRALDNVIAEIPGEVSEEIVFVGAHLDSMISFDPTYNPRVDPAPGADDDASGVAALLILAQTFKKLIESVGRPKKNIRFGFFNAEEVGLVGSASYARDQAAHTVPIIAMFELDMIGYNKKLPKSCELHAGILPFPDVEDRSIVLAHELKQIMASVSPDLDPQVYCTKTEPEGDPGDRRSDHGSFQERGYTACLAIEDIFPGPGGAETEGNPDYHRPTDNFVDYDYAADITRAVAAAVWLKAKA